MLYKAHCTHTHSNTLLYSANFIFISSSGVKFRLKPQSEWDSHSRLQQIDPNTAVRDFAIYGSFFYNTAVIGVEAYVCCSLFYLLIFCTVQTLGDAAHLMHGQLICGYVSCQAWRYDL